MVYGEVASSFSVQCFRFLSVLWHLTTCNDMSCTSEDRLLGFFLKKKLFYLAEWYEAHEGCRTNWETQEHVEQECRKKKRGKKIKIKEWRKKVSCSCCLCGTVVGIATETDAWSCCWWPAVSEWGEGFPAGHTHTDTTRTCPPCMNTHAHTHIVCPFVAPCLSDRM